MKKTVNTMMAIMLFATATFQGCASPTVVETKQINDSNLTCPDLTTQIEEADAFEKKAREERKVTGTNVAAAVLFWPALLGTYSNTEDAIKAAQERKQHLISLYEKKGCNAAAQIPSPPQTQTPTKTKTGKRS